MKAILLLILLTTFPLIKSDDSRPQSSQTLKNNNNDDDDDKKVEGGDEVELSDEGQPPDGVGGNHDDDTSRHDDSDHHDDNQLKDKTKGTEEEEEMKPTDIEEEEEPRDRDYRTALELITRYNFEDKAKGYELLKEVASDGNNKAVEQLAYGYLYGHVLKRNFSKSFELFTKLSNKGYPSGQQGLGFLYSLGIGVNSSQAKAILYYTFGALGGNSFSQMISGYRAFHGVATPQSCETALSYYRKVASKVAKDASIFGGSHTISKIRLIEEDEESSVFAGITDDEVDHYKDVFADSGAQLSLGLYYLFGLGGVERNLPLALDLLQRADSPIAYGLIGRIYAEGSPPEIPQSNETAIRYFKKAIEHKTAEGYTGLGIMYFYGLGVKKDYTHAMELFQTAVDKGSPEAHLYLGMGYLYGLGKQANPVRGVSSLQISSSQGGHILAQFHLAEALTKGLTGRKNCNQAVELYKSVSERGKWAWLHREAYHLYTTGDADSALLMYLHLGELGIEVAQCNAGFILEEDETSVMLNKTEILKRALVMWSRSATQERLS
ncbi:PREDICTED: protein sel-1 homolog 1-like isoform X2 [Amphimedon queenslandica]|uniref:Uncharacterized protein n=1 Tax=Amphimedon queenslandica TaxID=400682 RepID=A0AAN0IYG8_AMPQE|nr:PREDICTED: protein sel-1 homolog 1-like isoform X2 [Amphimedon queenslandica]|eukprot:XP_019849496.1 PREDICTED: protein sel-1 homolog 1-like isoform X2 [Amphimedon queenslandica]